MDYFKKIKEHRLISVIILCGAVFGATWMLYVNLMVEPRNLDIAKSNENTKLVRETEKPRAQPSSIAKTENKTDDEKKSLMEGTSFTSKFGFMVYISGADNDLKHANIYITLENQKDRNLRNISIGEKIKIIVENNIYSIEINSIRGRWVDLIIRKNA
jgi:hypothetical protein